MSNGMTSELRRSAENFTAILVDTVDEVVAKMESASGERLDDLETDLRNVQETVDTHENSIDDLQTRVETLENDIMEVRDEVVMNTDKAVEEAMRELHTNEEFRATVKEAVRVVIRDVLLEMLDGVRRVP